MVREEYLLDTNVCISILKNDRDIIGKVLSVGQSNCHISEITIAELFYGAAKSGRKSHFEDIGKIEYLFDVLPIYTSLSKYGEIKAKLEAKGQRLDEFDLLIGATAVQNGLTVVTANVRHFGRIPDLNVVNWENN